VTDTALYIGIGFFLLLGAFIQFFVQWRRHHRDFTKELEPVLRSVGLRFVSATWPGWFKVGPFPKLEVELGRPQSRVGGIHGEYAEYRIVTFRDSEGQTHEIWAKIEFEMFRLRRIRWDATRKRKLPEAAKELIEN